MKTCLCFSGGKNSTAMLLRLIELGKRPDKIVFADTLMEYPEMYPFIDKVEAHIGQRIIRTKPKNTFLKWFFKPFSRGQSEGKIHGFPFVIQKCWYQREAKGIPFDKINKTHDVVYIGFCKGEEKRVMKGSKFKYPLIEWGWTDRKCQEYCESKDLLNPLYKKFSRLGCWICPKQNKKSLRILRKDYPALWNILLQLEELSPNGFDINTNIQGEHDQRRLV